MDHSSDFMIFLIGFLLKPTQPLTGLPLTNPFTQPSIHPPIGGGITTNHESSNRIQLSQLGHNLFNI